MSEIIKGQLVKVGKKQIMNVVLPNKKGDTTSLPFPLSAKCFRDEDYSDGCEVEVTRDGGRIVKVTIVGKAESSPPPPPAPARQPSRNRYDGGRGPGGVRGYAGAPAGGGNSTADKAKASPAALGLPFVNPYTFLPFPTKAPARRTPTMLAIDEIETGKNERFTGVVDLEVKTLSPLLTALPQKRNDKDKGTHKEEAALTIGPDVVLPATGIRGALRTMLTMITGGTLGYLDEDVVLRQARDARLGPRKAGDSDVPKNAFLGFVEEVGDRYNSGRIRVDSGSVLFWIKILGDRDRLQNPDETYENDVKGLRPRGNEIREVWVKLDDNGPIANTLSATKKDASYARVKLAGRPVNSKGVKREGVFLDNGTTIAVDPKFWLDYENRHHGSMRPKLKKGDLVWLEPKDSEADSIRSQADVESIQWARWGRRGTPLVARVPKHVLPDYLAGDMLVDEVTDLFGQVSPKKDCPAPAFAARIRPENLVFFDAASKARSITLPALSGPKPGCLAFYRENASVDKLSDKDLIRGYKVYRTTGETGAEAPWNYDQQPVFRKADEPEKARNKQNKTSSIIPADVTGRLRIAFRALSRRELALLLLACKVDWRLGGGKPLGLGHCEVKIVGLLDEFGESLDHGVDTDAETQDLAHRVELWRKAVKPVDGLLRYPRAVDGKTGQRGGHVWFTRHAAPRKATRDGAPTPGLTPIHTKNGSPLHRMLGTFDFDPEDPMIAGQILPALEAEDQNLYGYDGILLPIDARPGRDKRILYDDFQKHNETEHNIAKKNEENHSLNRDVRRDQKRNRE